MHHAVKTFAEKHTLVHYLNKVREFFDIVLYLVYRNEFCGVLAQVKYSTTGAIIYNKLMRYYTYT